MITDLRFITLLCGTWTLQAYHAEVAGYGEDGTPHLSGRGHWESVRELPYGMDEIEEPKTVKP